jgi:ABC-2 type transport system ATP-binding protein
MPLVEVRSLSRHFGWGPSRVDAVRDVTFAFEGGDIMGFIGPNGAGKSTTMRILATLDLPSAGDCVVDGMSTVDEADRVRRLIGFMPDHFEPFPDATVAEYVDFFARAYGLDGEPRARAVAGVMEFCQLDGIAQKPATSLSKGMKQRLSLARCLVHDPKVLILDEPSAGLDPRARIEFRDLIRALARRGKGVLISSHILAELEEMCTAVAIIERGRLVAAGSVAQVRGAALAAREASSEAAAGDALPATIEIALAAEHPRFREVLAERPGIGDVQVSGRYATVSLAGGDAEHAVLLRALVEAGLPVSRFTARGRNLEDAFLHLTKGQVQ